MKILHVTPWYEPAWASGGTAVSVTNMCRELVKQGVEITVLTTTDAGQGGLLSSKSYEDNLGGVHIKYSACGFFGLKFRRAYLSLELVKNIFRFCKSFDVIHVHSTRHIYGLSVTFAAWLFKKPYIITPHASISSFWMESIGNVRIKGLYAKFIDRIYLSKACKIHYLSKFESESSSSWSFNSKFFVLPNGIQRSVFFTKIKAIRQGRRPLKLLHIGRIHPQKNTYALVKALIDLGSNIASLDVIGPIDDFGYFNLCQEAIEASKTKNITFLGSLPFDEVQSLYKNYDLFCMPSLVEGVSMALIEAASNGLPALISRNIGNWQEIIEDGAGAVCGLEPESIKALILDFYNHPTKLDEMALNAKNSADVKVQSEKNCERTRVPIYRSNIITLILKCYAGENRRMRIVLKEQK